MSANSSGKSNLPRDPAERETVPLVVIVEGFLGGSGGRVLWGNFEEHLNSGTGHDRMKRRAVFASVGPVSSLHDRACELFYALTGGTVDYGDQHCLEHRHSRYGRTIASGLYPEWSRDRPLHFLGHSMGGPTIIKLQYLLKTGFFGDRGNPDMVLSMTTISAPFRGTQLVYTLGEREDAAPAVKAFSLGGILAKGVHLISFLSPLLPRSLDLHTEARGLSYRETSLLGLLRQLWRSDWAESRDATPFDATFLAAEERESALEGELHPRTFYRSHVASMTKKSYPHKNHHHPRRSYLFSPLYLPSRNMGVFDYTTLRPIPAFVHRIARDSQPPTSRNDDEDVERGLMQSSSSVDVLGEEYWENDGVVPLFSQWHPFSCSNTSCRHLEATMPPHSQAEKLGEFTPRPAVWEVHHHDDANHTSLVSFWVGSEQQKKFWEDLGQWLRDVDYLVYKVTHHWKFVVYRPHFLNSASSENAATCCSAAFCRRPKVLPMLHITTLMLQRNLALILERATASLASTIPD
ncbi:hypothetical protein PLICRDRAFT_695164 [Plicaturopsis crispa FD-325 SS-3]|nr:hypothetical protein PLICRDRAFT_695164 [Plicaturopsis crispa FD-325 SS-3]